MEKTFYANGRTQEHFFAEINGWFAANRNIAVTKLYTNCKSSFGFLVNKSNLSEITIIYEQKNNQSNLYGIDYNESFSLVKVSMDKMKEKWVANNPQLQAVCWSYMHNARGQAGSLLLNGIGARNRNQLWMIYRVPSASVQPAVQPLVHSPVGQGVCPNCSYDNGVGASFCCACGYKIK